MKTYKRIFVVMLALALILPTVTVNAQGARSAAITFTTATPNPAEVGDQIVFDLNLSIANIEPGVSGVDIYLEYDATVTFAEVLPDFFGAASVRVNELTTCPSGVGTCVHLVLAGTPQVTKSGMLARLYFDAAAKGDACFSVVQSALVDADGFQVVHTLPVEQCVTVSQPLPLTMIGTALRQGAPANPNPGAGALTCTLVTVNGTAFKTDAAGSFLVDSMALEVGVPYTIRAAYPGYLSSEKTFTIPVGTVAPFNVGITTLHGGDVNGDATINILDIGVITGKFGDTGLVVGSASADCSTLDDPADINDDGQINISDLAIAAGNWAASATAWP